MIKRFIFSKQIFWLREIFITSLIFYHFLSLNIFAFRENLDENTQFNSKLRIKNKINRKKNQYGINCL